MNINIEGYRTRKSQVKVNGKWWPLWTRSSRKIYRIKVNGKYIILKAEDEESKHEWMGSQNNLEWNNYKKISTYDKRHIAKIYGKTSYKKISFLICEYIKISTKQRKKKELTLAKNIISKFQQKYGLGDLCFSMEDFLYDDDYLNDLNNWVFTTEGKVKILDYAL